MTNPQSTTNREPNNVLDMAGQFIPTTDVTHDDEDTNSHASDITLQRPAKASDASRDSLLVTFSPKPSQKKKTSWQSLCPSAHPLGSRAVRGPRETVHLLTQRARRVLNLQRETARRGGSILDSLMVGYNVLLGRAYSSGTFFRDTRRFCGTQRFLQMQNMSFSGEGEVEEMVGGGNGFGW